MKKKCFRIAALFVAVCTLFTGCAGFGEKQYEVANYQGEVSEGETKSDYNKKLFYRNDKQTDYADPFVFDNTEIDGYYYLYGTVGSCYCHRSKNLTDWEPVGNALDNMTYAKNGDYTEIRRATWDQIWAPEVVYDAEEELYYMFFSATPKKDETVVAGKGVKEGTPTRLMMVATSKYPYKDFRLVNFKDASSCGKENIHTYNETAGIMGKDGEYVTAYPHYFAKYLFFNPEEYAKVSDANGGSEGEWGGYQGSIDPHPYVDGNGDKYLFWVDLDGSPDCIYGVKMENWLKPDWSTVTCSIAANYWTVSDWEASKEGGNVETVPFEDVQIACNEGPALVEHNGKYYMTFSMNSYEDNSYQVAQAVADTPLGPYRKLTEAEGGLLLSGNAAGSQEISGTGHHGFVTVGKQMYIVYHRHNDFVKAGAARNHAIDEVKWVSNGDNLEVMYVNGPTCTVQPAIDAFSEYHNIAGEAKVSGEGEITCLTDGLLSINKYGNEVFMENIRETSISETTTFTFDFDSLRTVRAVMIYNSKLETTYFRNISRIEFVCEENGQDVVHYIKDLEFSSEYGKKNDYDGTLFYITPGAAAYAEFDELNVKTIRITVEVPEGQESVGISEIRILGK